MPCGDCSTDDLCRCGPGEVCGHCFDAAHALGRVMVLPEEPMGSEPSSTECEAVRTDGAHCFHKDTDVCCGCEAEKPRIVLPPKNAHHLCTCGHIKGIHPKNAQHECERCDCAEYRCDHSRCGWKPREECQHPNQYNYGLASGPPVIRYFYCPACKAKWETVEAAAEPEPPMTPEEEEQAPEDKAICGRCYTDHSQGSCEPAESPPPQPVRRPPYTVQYSVQGHLYEVAVPGDATVRAVDGALIIHHRLGPVAGIVQAAPIEESA